MDSDKVVVVGGGVIGCSTAYWLAKEGLNVTLFEKCGLASGASGANQGAVAAQIYDPPLLDLVLESQRLYKELKELPIDFEIDGCGSVVCASEEEQLSVLRLHAEKLRSSKVKTKLIEGDELRALEPSLSKEILEASLCPEDFLVNPIRLTYAFAEAAKTFGAKINTYTEVVKVVLKNGRVDSVVTDKGNVKTDCVVISAGAWSPLIEGLRNLRLPVKPQRGQLFVTEPMPPCHFRLILDVDYLTTSICSESAGKSGDLRIRRGVASALSQTKSGHWLIGSSRDFSGFDNQTELSDLELIACRSLKFLPYIRHVNVLRTFASFRPYSPDDLPILGKVPNVEGLFLATGHCGNGIALAPVTGKAITEIIIKDKTSMKIDEFSCFRFDAD
ncbi:MAG: NAD(P)/FAD-dependent oxidoreductase [Candidatus Bathycorpusculaceae bacterium]